MAVQSRTSKKTNRETHRVLWRLNGKGAWQSVTVGHTPKHRKQADALNAWLKDVHGYRLTDGDPRIDEWLGRDTTPAEPEPSALTVRDAVHAFIYETPDRAERTVMTYRATLGRLGDLGRMTVAELTARDLNRWFAAHDAKGYAPKTMAVSKACLQGSLKPHREIASLFAGIKYDNNARLSDPFDLTDEQVNDLIANAGDAGLALLIRVAVETGMRRGELAGLTAGDIDLDRKLIRVRFQLAGRASDSRRYGFERAPLKAARHRRDIPIGDELADALALVAELPHDAPVFSQPGKGKWSATKEWWLYDALARALAAVVTATPSVPNSVTMHDTRHTAGMRWLRQGASLGLVSKLLGHANVKITDECYSHWNDADASRLIRNAALVVGKP